MKALQSANVYVGSKFNKLLVIPTFPPSQPFPLGGGINCPISSIYSSQILSDSANLQCIFSNSKDVFKLLISSDKIEGAQQNNKEINPFEYEKICEIPLGVNQKDTRIISCFGDASNYYTVNNKGEIFYQSHEKQDQQLVKINDNDSFFSKNCLSTKKEYKQCTASKNCQYFAVVGRDLLPFVFDRDQGIISWKGKNVANDHLDLQVPIYDVDAKFYKSSICLAVANANKKVRIYDVRSRTKKPIADHEIKKIDEKCELTKIVVSSDQNYFYVGNAEGGIYELDTRRNLGIVGKFKGSTTTVKGLQVSQELLISCSLDGYLRIFNRENKQVLQKSYLNISPSQLCLPYDFRDKYLSCINKQEEDKVEEKIENKREIRMRRNRRQRNEQEDERIEEVNKKEVTKRVKQLRTRNKVGLWYLKPENIGQFPDVDDEEKIKLEAKSEHLSDHESSSLI